MRSSLNLPGGRALHLAAGAFLIATPASAVALSAGQADAQSAIQFHLNRARLGVGGDIVATGTAPQNDAGKTLALTYAPGRGGSWRTIARTRIPRSGRFRLRAPVLHSGLVRVVDPSGNASSAPVNALAVASSPTGIPPSPSQQVAVAARMSVPGGPIASLDGQRVDIRGRLSPWLSGRLVRLQERSGGGRWHTVTSAHTGKHGGFDLHYRPAGSGLLRVRFAGDQLNTAAGSGTRRLVVLHPSVASWYNDGGSTACGFHAGLGVANRTLPCGTKVTIEYGGRTVTATVDDRGPFVGGRDWDLNQNTAGALGFGGVGTVWTDH